MPHSDAPLGLPTGLWLELAGLFLLLPWVMGLVGAGGPGAQGPRGLSWAVRLDGPEGEGAEELLERWADALAQATGLMNAGRIVGEFDREHATQEGILKVALEAND